MVILATKNNESLPVPEIIAGWRP